MHHSGKLKMDSLNQTHFAFSPHYSSPSLPLPHPSSLLLLFIAYISPYRHFMLL